MDLEEILKNTLFSHVGCSGRVIVLCCTVYYGFVHSTADLDRRLLTDLINIGQAYPEKQNPLSTVFLSSILSSALVLFRSASILG